MGKGKKSKETFNFEVCLKVITYLVAFMQFSSIIGIRGLSTNLFVVYSGLFIALTGVVIFIIAMVTMSDSWRVGIDVNQRTDIIKTGIYKYSRNPAFIGFDLLYIGVAIIFPSIILICISGIAILMLHFQIVQEEKNLSIIFGDEYESYKRQTPRYFLI